MPNRRYRVLFVASLPLQYQAPLFGRMARHPSLDLHVAYCSLRGAEAGHDPEFGANIQWDVPLLDGYSWTNVPNRGSGAESFFGLFNPGLWKLIRGGNYDAVVSYVGYVRASFWVALAAAKLSNAAFIFGTDAVSLTPRDGPAWKRPLDLLRAFAKADPPNTLLLFAGAGPLLRRLESEAASLGIASRVRFLGFANQSQLPAVYTAADLLVLPSEFEPFGLVVNEAMCCGCAVAASDRCGAARDLVAPVDPRLVFPCGDVAALATILRDAAIDRPRLQSVARVGLAHIQTWSPERNIAATTEAVRLAVSRIGRPPIEHPSDSVAPAGRQGIDQ